MRGLFKVFLTSVIVLAAACGGDDPPKPLGSHYDDNYIVGVPMDQRGNVITAQNDYNVAKMENANAEAQVKEAEQNLSVAHNDAKAAQLGVDSGTSNKKLADQSLDQNRISQAGKDLSTATDLKKATDARVHYLEDYVRYLRKYQRYTLENLYFKEAGYESAKAQVGQRNNIAPKGVVYDSYNKQTEDRQRRTDKAKSVYQNMRSGTQSSRDTWLRLQQQADSENGHAGTYWDPLASKGGPPN